MRHGARLLRWRDGNAPEACTYGSASRDTAAVGVLKNHRSCRESIPRRCAGRCNQSKAATCACFRS
jgi:hypothetical protein